MSAQLVVYDSYFGNTEKIAQAIAEALGDANLKRVQEVNQSDLENLKVLVVGSPTRAFRPTPAIMNFVKSLDREKIKKVKAAAFDTRIPKNQTDSGFLKFMINLFGYADVKIARALSKTSAELVIESTGFGVKGTEGPLLDGELERAKTWAKGLHQ